MSKYDKEREALGIPTGAPSADFDLSKSKYAAERAQMEQKPKTKPVSMNLLRPSHKTAVDPVKNVAGVPVGMNIIQPYAEDNPLQKVGKGLVNYGVGTAGRIAQAPAQAMMDATVNLQNIAKGKPLDFSEKSFTKDILPASVGQGLEGLKKNHPVVGGFVQAAAEGLSDPTTYVGGGILDDLTKAGTVGKAAKVGTQENMLLQLNKNKSIPVKPKVEPTNEVTSKHLDATQLKDISGFRAYTTDVYRNFRDVFGNQYEQVKKRILDPFDASKKANVDMQKDWVDKLKTEVVDRLGIKKGSKESALVQQYGEKKIALEELKKQRPNEWQKIVEADKWFRKAYDQLLDEVNAVRAQIYPNDPEKIVPKRQDYYRHFRELSDTIEGVKNLFETPSAIDPNLAGVSDFTLPKSRFAGFMQKRGLGPYKNDAVGGFLEYLPAASYAKNIDPHIGRLESLANELADSTAESKNINNFIEYLRDFSRDLAGKTNPADRFFQKIVPGGRTTFRIINWLNSRVKANSVLGNVGSALSQLANIPQGIAFAKQHSAAGLGRTMKGILTKDKGPISKSGFIAERYATSDIYRQFDTKMLDRPKQFASWMLEAVDRIGTEFIWNSAYAKGVAEGAEDAVKYADDMTRNLVAGRGIGEVPILQKSRLFQIIAPFQLEVANLWQVQRDFVKAKDFGGLVGLYLANYMFNRVMEETRGSGVTFDPINAMMEAFAEEDTTAGQKAGRLAGEVLSNLPLGQTAAAQLPEERRKELFGKQDPTRFGTGLILTKGMQNPASRLVLPFGGAQIEKIFKGATALGINPLSQVPAPGVYNSDKTQLKYPVEPDLPNTTKGLLFGTTGLRETRDYYDNNRRPLSAKQTEEFIKKTQQGQDPAVLYERLQLTRQINRIDEEIKELQKSIAPDKQKKIEMLKLKKAKLAKELRGGK
jgi:hypothetical protein